MTIMQQLQNKQVQATLKSNGIVHLWLFGSHAKGINNEDSDVDLLYEHNYDN